MNAKFTLLPAACALLLAACESGGPMRSTTGFDPLDPAGGFNGSGPRIANTGIQPGTFVKTSMDNAAFFRERPKGNANADKLLPANTPMKVIANDGSYLKVELDSGETGYIPPVMVIDQTASPAAGPYSDDEVQVWPPPAGAMPAGIDPYEEATPTIPTTIDPDAPTIEEDPPLPVLPDDAPTPGLGAEPPLPDTGSAIESNEVDVTPQQAPPESSDAPAGADTVEP